LLLFLLIPAAHAEEEECGLLNLASCIPQKIYDFLLMYSMLYKSTIGFYPNLLNEPVGMSLVYSLYGAIILFFHLFYGNPEGLIQGVYLFDIWVDSGKRQRPSGSNLSSWWLVRALFGFCRIFGALPPG